MFWRYEIQSMPAVAQKGGFWSYVAGVAYWMLVEQQVGGIVIDNYETTLPMNKGLSSSAAVCVLVCFSLHHLGHFMGTNITS